MNIHGYKKKAKSMISLLKRNEKELDDLNNQLNSEMIPSERIKLFKILDAKKEKRKRLLSAKNNCQDKIKELKWAKRKNDRK